MTEAAFYVYLVFIALGFLMGVLSYQKYPKLRPVVLLLVVTFISEITAQICAIKFRNNMPVYHIFSPIQLTLLGLFFFANLQEGFMKRALPAIVVTAIGFCIINIFFIQGINAYPSYFVNLESLIVILYSSVLFIQFLERPSSENIFKNPVFIAIVAILWFYIFSFLYFLLYGYLTKIDIPSTLLGTVHLISNYIYYLMLFIATLTAYLQTSNDKIKY